MSEISAQDLRAMSAINLKSDHGLRVWLDLMLGCLEEMLPIPVPEKPYELRGVESWHIRKLLDSGKGEKEISKEERGDLRAWRKWRDDVIAAETRNTNTLHGLLLLVWKLDGDENREHRYRVEYLLSNKWSMDGAELANMLSVEGLYFIVRKRCLKLNRCAHDWREPRWKGCEYAGS